MEKTIENIIIAACQSLIINALQSLIETDERFLLAGIAGNHHELNRLLSKVPTGLLIADFTCLDFIGIDDLRNIRNEFPHIAILILTNSITKVERYTIYLHHEAPKFVIQKRGHPISTRPLTCSEIRPKWFSLHITGRSLDINVA